MPSGSVHPNHLPTMKLPSLIASLLIALPAAHAGEAADLIRLYEEEIFAHDLYVELAAVHPDIMPLRNIPHAELRHRDAMAAVLEKAGIPIPKSPKNRRFRSAGLDDTYEDWLAEGRRSEAAACRVGVRLEELDIADLRAAAADFPAHARTLNQLEQASIRHLQAFHRNLSAREGKYTPEIFTPSEFEELLDSANDCGTGRGKAMRRKRGQGNGRAKGSGGNGKGKGNGKGRGQGRGKGRGNGR